MVDPAWVALSLTEHVGGKTLRSLMQHFNGDTRAILAADTAALRRVPGVGPVIARHIQAINLQTIELAIPRWQAAGVEIVTLDTPRYPARLRQLPDAPPTLFLQGAWPETILRSVAIVGTRTPSPQSQDLASSLGAALAERGYTVISGLALGVDTAAHLGALAVPGSTTLAVLGCGVLNVYPRANQGLAEAIRGRGALLAEVHPESVPNPAALVARNRIISGLSDALIVVETGADGGAMYAARFALKQGRMLYTVANDADGNQQLLREGALPIAPDLKDLPFG
ncbi:MAG: DNA-processing protein DprA [Anaerolineaceae bacterium]|nr:DNA-processing protein DprA [Anaerolineaceae bacterium]